MNLPSQIYEKELKRSEAHHAHRKEFSLSGTTTKRNKTNSGIARDQPDTRVVRKNNNEIGFKVKSGHLSLLSRKLFNILIWYAQDLRDQEEKDGRWCVAVAKLIKDARFNSRDYDLLRSSLDELQEVRVIRPRLSGGVTSEILIPSYTLDNVSHDGNEAAERGQKKRGGCLMLWFMLPPELKSQMLDPEQYTRLPISYMVLLRTIPGFALYEICRRYVTNPGGVTNRNTWQNWWHILAGATDDVDPPEYKYAKRDVFKRAKDEINAITDIEVELIEFKVGKSVREIQFSVKLKQQANLDMGPPAIEASLLSRIVALGISISDAERLSARFSETDIADTITLVEARMGKTHLEKLDSPAAFFKKALNESWAKAKQLAESAKEKQGEERKAKQLEKSQAIEDAKQDKQRQYQAVSEKFVALPEEKRSELLKEFAGTLAASNQAIFRKSGINSKMLSATFAKWLLENQV
jgi:hypothetical protein